MPNAIYSYVYYEPLPESGMVTRQNRSSVMPPVPGITVPATATLHEHSTFQPVIPPATYTDSNAKVYNFGFMNVSGCVGTGEVSTDINNLPGYGSSPALIVTNHVINILVVYIRHEFATKGPRICLDAFEETNGVFFKNNFLTGINPDFALIPDVEAYGYLPVQGYEEYIVAAPNPKPTRGDFDNTSVFEKWGKLEGPDGNPVIGDNRQVTVNREAKSNISVFAFYKQQVSVYITGGYHSPDIILFEPFSATTPGINIPMGSVNTRVIEGVHYGFGAVVHNDSAYDANTSVTFWNIPGGAGLPGTFLDTRTVVVPAHNSVTVLSSQPFINSSQHHCAAVSISAPDSPCQFNPTSSNDSANIPSPVTVPGGAVIPRSCSAWRNTDAIIALIAKLWQFEIALGDVSAYETAPIGIRFATRYVAAGFENNDKVREIIKANAGIYSKTPAYLIPQIMEALPAADLKTVVTLISKGSIEEQKDSGYILNFADKKETTFKVSGVVPGDGKAGDTYLVQVTAQYPKTGRLPARSVGFLEVLVVNGK
jgi:hypothetical protein